MVGWLVGGRQGEVNDFVSSHGSEDYRNSDRRLGLELTHSSSDLFRWFNCQFGADRAGSQMVWRIKPPPLKTVYDVWALFGLNLSSNHVSASIETIIPMVTAVILG